MHLLCVPQRWRQARTSYAERRDAAAAPRRAAHRRYRLTHRPPPAVVDSRRSGLRRRRCVGALYTPPEKEVAERFAEGVAEADYDGHARRAVGGCQAALPDHALPRRVRGDRRDRDGDHDARSATPRAPRDGRRGRIPVTVSARAVFGTVRGTLRLPFDGARPGRAHRLAPRSRFPGVEQGQAPATPHRAAAAGHDPRPRRPGAGRRARPLDVVDGRGCRDGRASWGRSRPKQRLAPPRARLPRRRTGRARRASSGRSSRSWRGARAGRCRSTDGCSPAREPRPAAAGAHDDRARRSKRRRSTRWPARAEGSRSSSPGPARCWRWPASPYSAPGPPGSTFKIMTTTAALEDDKVKLDRAVPGRDGGRRSRACASTNAGGESCGGTFVDVLRALVQLGVRPARRQGRGKERLVETAETLRLERAAADRRRGGEHDAPAERDRRRPRPSARRRSGRARSSPSPLQMASVGGRRSANHGVRMRAADRASRAQRAPPPARHDPADRRHSCAG